MYKHIIGLVFCIFFSNLISAQHILFDWQSCLKGGKYTTDRNVICQADNEYFIAAMQERGSHVDIVLIKTTMSGDSLWTKYFGGSDAEWPCGIFPTMDGKYYIVGTECSSDGDVTNNPYPGFANIWVIKIDSSGNKLWDKVYGGSNSDEAMNAVVTYDGGMAILGSTFSCDGDITNCYGERDIWVLKLDNNGNKLWDFTIGAMGFDYSFGIIQTQDSGFIISGAFTAGYGGNIECYNADSNFVDGLLFQLDKHGEPVHKKCFHGSLHNRLGPVIELPDGYLVTGVTDSPDIASANIGFHPGYTSNGYPTSDIWLQKIDYNLNVEWQRCYGGSGDEYINSIYQCSYGDYMMFGTTNSNDGDVIGNHSVSPYNDIWMVRLNSLGDVIWQRCIGKFAGERLQMNSIIKLDEAHYILSVEAEGCIMDDDFTCTTTDDPYHCYNYVWLIQIHDTAASVGIYEPIQTIQIKLYPNPATEYITLEIPVAFDMKHTLAEILDVSGKIIQSTILTGQKPYLYTGSLPAGLYLLRLVNKDGFVGKRFVKVKN